MPGRPNDVVDASLLTTGAAASGAAGAHRVLLVEDDDDQRRLLASLLRREGLEPVVARNAEDGLDILDGRECRLAVFDVQLPGMSGLHALGIIARQHPALPVVLMTAAGDVREARALSLGAKAFLRKPFSAADFLAAVRAALGPTNMSSGAVAGLG